ncbi:TIGR02679 family protein [Anaerosolibacter sp.]|uniref:TIGR02679 family protein n=1 Tax=Anaerosolibacter sp. TaxID=1872527 RepID=UPI0039EF60E6
MERECVQYFKENPGFKRLLQGLKDKYQSLGSLGGTVQLDNLTDVEKDALSGLFRKDFYRYKSVTIRVEKVVKALEGTRFEGVNMEDVLRGYFGDELLSKRETRNRYETQRRVFFQHILQDFEGSHAHHWLEHMLESKSNPYKMLHQKYDEDKEALRKLLMLVMEGINMLSFQTEKPMRLALFSSVISKNPHTFDLDTECGNLLLHGIVYCLGLSFPQSAEAKTEVLYKAGIIKDEVSNFTTFSGLIAYKAGEIHKGWQGFYESQEPLQVSLWNLSQIGAIKSSWKKVFVFENPTVFSEVLQSLGHIKPPLVCTYGQIKLASLILLDKLADHVELIYYAGDFDPEGLRIADRLKDRYGEKLVTWRYDIKDYEMIKSYKKIESSRMKKLDGIKASQLQKMAEHIKRTGYTAYQELLIEQYIEDIQEWLKE